MSSECKLCGLPASNEDGVFLGYYINTRFSLYYKETFKEVFFEWNDSLNLFCRKHIQIACNYLTSRDRKFQHIYDLNLRPFTNHYDKETKQYIRGWGYERPTDDEINGFLCYHLMQCYKRYIAKKPIDACAVEDCGRFAVQESKGHLLCGVHANRNDSRGINSSMMANVIGPEESITLLFQQWNLEETSEQNKDNQCIEN